MRSRPARGGALMTSAPRPELYRDKPCVRYTFNIFLEEDTTGLSLTLFSLKWPKMKLYLAIAALMLVLIAHTEAQEALVPETANTADIQTKLKEFGEDLTEKTINALKTIEQSEFASKTRSWLAEQFEKLKQKVDETFTKTD
ncbi:apolipoprotein C-I-like isoform X1 [Brachyhypopomus gauderio]|uniref:apolipoprotein C-I-like isoform X1 n=1 Tax=Brachyhypopomus gauderio TaxID=698409 RepID=UPI0040419CE4